MNFSQTPLHSEIQWKNRNTGWLWISALATLLFAGSEFFALWKGGNNQYWAILPIFMAAPFFFWLVLTNRQAAAGIFLIAAIGQCSR